MKRAALILFALAMLLSLAACAANDKTEVPAPSEETQQIIVETEPSEAPAEDIDTESVDEDPDFYSVATSYSKKEVEDFAASVRADILDKNWTALSEKMYFPVYISGEEVKTAGEFVSLMNENDIPAEFFEAVEAESCKDMSANSHGIMFGSGEVWIAEYLDDINADRGQLYVIGLNL